MRCVDVGDLIEHFTVLEEAQIRCHFRVAIFHEANTHVRVVCASFEHHRTRWGSFRVRASVVRTVCPHFEPAGGQRSICESSFAWRRAAVVCRAGHCALITPALSAQSATRGRAHVRRAQNLRSHAAPLPHQPNGELSTAVFSAIRNARAVEAVQLCYGFMCVTPAWNVPHRHHHDHSTSSSSVP